MISLRRVAVIFCSTACHVGLPHITGANIEAKDSASMRIWPATPRPTARLRHCHHRPRVVPSCRPRGDDSDLGARGSAGPALSCCGPCRVLWQSPEVAMTERRPWFTILYVQVLIAIAIGVLIGHLF